MTRSTPGLGGGTNPRAWRMGVGLMVIQWDGRVWGMATARRRVVFAAAALLLALASTAGVVYADEMRACSEWLCLILGICGDCLILG
jgi:hypothetical protein